MRFPMMPVRIKIRMAMVLGTIKMLSQTIQIYSILILKQLSMASWGQISNSALENRPMVLATLVKLRD